MTTCAEEKRGAVSIMNLPQKIVGDAIGSGSAVSLMITAGDAKVTVADPETLMEDMWERATKVGPVLEGIIQESHPETCWD